MTDTKFTPPSSRACVRDFCIRDLIIVFCLFVSASTFSFTILLKDNGKDLQWDTTLGDHNNKQFQQLANKVLGSFLFENAHFGIAFTIGNGTEFFASALTP